MDIFKKYCFGCAKCCKRWTIFTTFKECEIIKNRTGLNYAAFCEFAEIPEKEFKKYAKYGHFYQLAFDRKVLQLRRMNERCIFLKNENECLIYPFRPYICKLFPFWFDKNKEPVFCIGRDICPIPDEELLEHKQRNYKVLKQWIKEYAKFIEDYKNKIDRGGEAICIGWIG